MIQDSTPTKVAYFNKFLGISNIIEKAIIDENAAYVFINNITMLILKYLP